MAKQEKGEKEQKANLYLLAIVAIVAVVGIVVLILNSAGSTSLNNGDYSGQAIKASSKIISASKIATVTSTISTKGTKTDFKLAPIGDYQCYFIRGETYCFDDRECPTSMEIKDGSITYVCEVECDNDKPDSSGTCECDYKLDKNGQKMCVSV